MLLVKNVLSISQEQVSCTLEDFTLVDILLHGIDFPSYVVKMLVHQLYYMEMIEDVHRIRTILQYRGYECR